MLDRQKIEAILARRFPGSTRPQIAAATNAIMGMHDEREELSGHPGSNVAQEIESGTDLRLIRRRESSS